jgi:hypothetical protein
MTPSNQDDEDWLEALEGRPNPAASEATNREAALLRQAYQELARDLPQVEPRRTDEDALVARAHALGLGSTPPPAADRGLAGRLREVLTAVLTRPWMGALAGGFAVALLAVMVWPLWQASPGDDTVLRQPAGAVLLRRVQDPQTQRNRLAEQLVAVGAQVTRYERLGRYGLDAVVPQPLSPQARDLLVREGLVLAIDGSLSLEFEAR